MQFKVKRTFSIQVTSSGVKQYLPGLYVVPSQMPKEHAIRCAQQRAGTWINEKKAPENKNLGKAPESKSKVAKKTGNRRGTGAKSNA